MKPDATIDSVSMSSMGWLRETVNLPTPQSQTDTVVVPGPQHTNPFFRGTWARVLSAAYL